MNTFCFDDWINDGECDQHCNTEQYGFDGSDCYHGHSECYIKERGEDYRGSVNVTSNGRDCRISIWVAVDCGVLSSTLRFFLNVFFTHDDDDLVEHSRSSEPA